MATNPSRKKTLKKRSTRSLDSELDRLEAQHRVLLQHINSIGIVLRGTIQERFLPCGKPNCRCKATPPVLHGPYALWTRKVAGKTVTVRLTADQALRCQAWTHNMHDLDRLVRDLHAIGLKAAVLVKKLS